MAAYLSLLVVFVLAVLLIGGILVLSHLLNPQRSTNPAKGEAYECGIIPKGDARAPVSIRFFVMALLFLIFDIEVVFLFPWAVVYHKLMLLGWIEMVIFLGILLVGYFYAWGQGAFDWK